MMAALALTACGKTEEPAEDKTIQVDSDVVQEAEAEESAEVGMANPWTDSDQQGVLQAMGFDMTSPEGATDVKYSYSESLGIAQMTYELDNASWTYRMQSASELSDISGMEYEWTDVQDGQVAGLEAKYYAYSDATEDTEYIDNVFAVQVVDWYDAAPGVLYSLSVSGTDINGLDIQVFAEQLYTPLQGDADGDDASSDTELGDYFLGTFTSTYDDSTLIIDSLDGGKFYVSMSLTGLCSLDNGVATFENHQMSFTIEDPNGGTLQGTIYRDADNSLVIRFDDSSWELIASGDTFEGFVR